MSRTGLLWMAFRPVGCGAAVAHPADGLAACRSAQAANPPARRWGRTAGEAGPVELGAAGSFVERFRAEAVCGLAAADLEEAIGAGANAQVRRSEPARGAA